METKNSNFIHHLLVYFLSVLINEFLSIYLHGNSPIGKAKQLKDYENAVIAKRLEELDDDEVQALVEDIERDDF